MKTITVRASGDTWLNSAKVIEQLVGIEPIDWVCFDTGAEGISLEYSGILKFINQWVETSGHPRDRVIINSPNNYEKTPYKNICESKANHFFAMSGHYQTAVPNINPRARQFGFFVGRHTKQRNQIALDIINNYREQFVMSIMKSRYIQSPWSEELQVIPSIDNLSINDQYQGEVDTNLSLLQYYNRFQIELVAETMCMGTTFFPTEKTIRPILGGRPFLIFGPKNFLSNLQQLGFKTYNDCWNENYDQLEDMERWQAMREVIETIKTYDIDRAQQIAHYNQQHLKQWHQLIPPKNMPRVIDDR
jgi:hypothetical protein